MMNNNDLEKYNSVISLWIRWDESYWTSFNMFVIITGLFFAGFAQVYNIDNKGFALAFCFAGIVISVLWLLTLNRKFVHLTCAEEEARKLEGKIYGNNEIFGCFTSTKKYALKDKEHIKKIDKILGQKKIFARKGTGTIMACYFPIAITGIWILLGMLISLIFLFISIFFLVIMFTIYLLTTSSN